MAKENINLPAGYGGLMRYNEEYKSKFMLEPKHVIIFIILIISFIVLLRLFFPLS